MNMRLRGLVFAGTAALGFLAAGPGQASTRVASPPTFSDFGFSESAGQYTITNNSSDAYIYGFSVTNPLAGVGTSWNSQPAGERSFWWDCGSSCDAGSFVYWNPGGQTDTTYDIAPGQSASDFYFNVPDASKVTFDVVQRDVTGAYVSYTLAAPEASTWVMMLGGFSLLGWFVCSRRELLRQQC